MDDPAYGVSVADLSQGAACRCDWTHDCRPTDFSARSTQPSFPAERSDGVNEDGSRPVSLTFQRGRMPPAFNKEKLMPLVRIDLSSTASPKLRQTVSDVVYDTMITVAKVPADDKFQIVTGHAADELVFPKEGYLGIDYTDGIIFIQVTWNAGRSTEVKKAFYRKIADDLHSKAGVRKQDVFINLVDVLPENWSFGNGEMQYAPKQ